MTVSFRDSMLELLSADGPDPDHAEAMMLYGRLVGTWKIDNRFRLGDGQWRGATGEWRFGWVLGGRTVQDVLFCPEFHDRYPGTTVRMYDATTGLWRITRTRRWLASFARRGTECSRATAPLRPALQYS